MVEANRPAEEMTRENCLEDWRVVHWAIETDQWGKDLEYKLCSLEEAEQFSNRRNYPLGESE